MSYRCGSRTDSGSKCKRKVAYEGEKCYDHDTDKKSVILKEKTKSVDNLLKQMIAGAEKRIAILNAQGDYESQEFLDLNELTLPEGYSDEYEGHDYNYMIRNWGYLLNPVKMPKNIKKTVVRDSFGSPPKSPKKSKSPKSNSPPKSHQGFATMGIAKPEDFEYFSPPNSPPKSPKKLRSPPKSPKKIRRKSSDLILYDSPPDSPPKSSPKLRRLKKRV